MKLHKHWLHKFIECTCILSSAAIMIAAIKFSSYKQKQKLCKNVQIHIQNISDQLFISPTRIDDTIAKLYNCSLTCKKIIEISGLKIQNSIISSEEFVDKVTVYKTFSGNIKINIVPKVAIARIIVKNEGPEYNGHCYICSNGFIAKLSKNYTARVMLVEVPKALDIKNLNEDKYWSAVLDLLMFIEKSNIWKHTIDYVQVCDNKDIKLYPNVGKHCVELGSPYNFEEKFMKLQIFYSQIVPYKGWEAYKNINLKFSEQIVCKRNRVQE